MDTTDAVRMIGAAMADRPSDAEAKMGTADAPRAFGGASRPGGKRAKRLEGTARGAEGPAVAVCVAGAGRESAQDRIGAEHAKQLCRLLTYLPRLGLIHEAVQLLETIQGMEFEHPQGPGAITEFDRVFQIGCRAIVRALVKSSADWTASHGAAIRIQGQ